MSKFIIKLFPNTRRELIRTAIVWGVALILAIAFGVYMCAMPGKTHQGPLAPLTAEELQLRDRLKTHIQKLAGEIGVRELERHPKALEAAAGYIRTALADLGTTVGEQAFKAAGQTVRNLEVEYRGTARPEEILVVGAHYDSMPATPGADDNASGVAGVLELARLLRRRPLERTVRLVAYVNEENPYFGSAAMGSLASARRSRERGEKLIGMFSLECIGYYSDAPGSQRYPFPFNLIYPKTGNFIGFVGNVASRALVRRTVKAFRKNAAFPSEGTAAPGKIEGIGWSDHWAYWEAGYPALMVTDTAFFRNANYHTKQDTPETIDYDRTARVVAGLAKTIEDLTAGK